MTQDLLISGMFRSGTTLLSRMLSARPEYLIVSDPFVYFFKAYRDHHLQRAGATGWHPDEPTSDWFLSPHHGALQRILAAGLDEDIPQALLARLRSDIRAWKGEQHPRLCARLEEVEGETFAEVYRGLIRLAVELYGSEATQVAGTKLSWCEEFLPALARAFPEMRFVLLIRDLRAIVASQNSQRGVGEGKRPLLFYVRHWRKSVAFARRFTHGESALSDRVRLVRYEDLVSGPTAALEELCSFARLRFDPQMVRVEAFRSEGEDGAWRPNSSYGRPATGIYTASLERWREVLSAAEIDAVNALAGPELALMGYDLPGDVMRPAACLGTACEPDVAELAPWIQPFPCSAYLREPHERVREYAAEDLRRAVIEGSADVDPDTEQRLLLDRGLLSELREAWRS